MTSTRPEIACREEKYPQGINLKRIQSVKAKFSHSSSLHIANPSSPPTYRQDDVLAACRHSRPGHVGVPFVP
ncbi:hypothetical protein VTJ04DRAFT_8369 [Mycothermus thermophilus]|uniref:uncharacterized protein n=1 Tax=Humicola insolens TaxID=85995 RepID=UPI003743EFA5